jgi:hypothetical protein
MCKDNEIGYLSCSDYKRNVGNISIEESEGRSQIGRPRIRWKIYVKMYLKVIGFEDVYSKNELLNLRVS